MPHDLINIITTGDPEVRNRSLDGFCRDASAETLLEAVCHLDHFRRESARPRHVLPFGDLSLSLADEIVSPMSHSHPL